MSTFKKHVATGFVAAFIALPAFAQSPAEHPTTPPPPHEKQAPGVEAHLKTFDVLDFVGKRAKKDASKARITCAVTIGPRDGGGFGLAVKLSVQDKSLPQAELAALAREAHEQICPYSHATRNNVPVELEVSGA